MVGHDTEAGEIQDNINRALRDPSGPEAPELENKLNIVCTGTHLKDASKYVFKILPDNYEILRTLPDLYWLRANLCIEFPFYYV